MIAKNGMYVNTSANKIMWMGDDGFIVQQGNQALKLDSANGMQWGRQTGSGSSVQLQWFNFWNYRPFTTTSSMTRQYMLVPTINEYRYCFVINASTQHGDLWVDLPAYDDGGSPKQTWIILPPTSTIPQGWQVRIIYMMSQSVQQELYVSTSESSYSGGNGVIMDANRNLNPYVHMTENNADSDTFIWTGAVFWKEIGDAM